MLLIWVVVYAVTILVAKYLSAFTSWAMPLLLLLYVVALTVWLRTKRPDTVPVRRVTRSQLKEQFVFLPYLVPVLYHLLCHGMPAHSVPAVLGLAYAVVLEELVFRGVLLRYLYKKWRIWGLIIAAFLFAAVHFVNLEHGNVPFVLYQVIFAFAAGVALGGVSLLCRSLVPVIGIHLFINLTAPAQTTGDPGFWGSVVVYLLMGLRNITLLNKKGKTYETVY